MARTSGGRRDGHGTRRIVGRRSPAIKARTSTVIALLSCHCSAVFKTPSPKVADDVYCRRHGSVTVLTVSAEWRAVCEVCRYRRPFGAAELSCKTAASSHAVKKGHVVQIMFGSTIVEITGNRRQLDFSGLEEPPF